MVSTNGKIKPRKETERLINGAQGSLPEVKFEQSPEGGELKTLGKPGGKAPLLLFPPYSKTTSTSFLGFKGISLLANRKTGRTETDEQRLYPTVVTP